MKPKVQCANFAWGEYILPDLNQNTEVVGARWEFIEVVRDVFPRFFEQLREQVYPNYASLVKSRSGYWETGWTFDTWQLNSDPERRLTPCLLAWAAKFNAAEETWILEGALQTLWFWHGHSEWRESLDTYGFHASCAVNTLSGGAESLFQFRHPGWDPQFQRWPSFRASIRRRFQSELKIYEQRLRSLVESQGAVRARSRFTSENFAWFALYQLGGMSTGRILKQYRDLEGDESTILKGVKTAANLLQWKHIRKGKKALP